MNNKELVENNMQNEEFKKVFSNIKYINLMKGK